MGRSGTGAKVTVSDVSGNRSDTFNPDVSTGPKCSQEFFPFKVAPAESYCLLCSVIYPDSVLSR